MKPDRWRSKSLPVLFMRSNQSIWEKRGKIITGIISQASCIACWVYVQDRKKMLQDVSDDGAIYMFPSVYICIGITYNKTLLEVHGWKLPKFFADLETWQRKQRRRGCSCAWHRSNIRKNRSKICVDFKKNYWREENHVVCFLKKEIILKANLLKGRGAKPEGTKVRKFDHVSRLPLFPYHHNIWKRCVNKRDSDTFYTI